MNKKTLAELDYYRIKECIAGYCTSEEGRDDILNREPFTAQEEYAALKELSAEWRTCLSSAQAFSVSYWPPVQQIFPVLKTAGAAVSPEELYALGLFCRSQKKVTDSIKSNSAGLHLKSLSALVSRMPDLAEPENIIFSILTSDGELKELPSIRGIKKNIAALKTEINSLIHKYTIDTSLSDVLESNVPALRADRQLLAVKASKQSRVKGIVHEVSQTGQTVYIEPDDIVKKNNELIQEEFRLQEEIKKILLDATEKLSEYRHAFSENLPNMILLDTTCAAAKWGIENNCVYALPCRTENAGGKTTREPPLLLGARHPLLKENAIPVTVQFLQNKNVLIITGPNTGGKTVTLKTFALFVLLNQSGFPVPALEGTRLPLFTEIFCDIGDEQSLNEQLSTFSGHMKNLTGALTNAKDDSLVLLDELGSGTDPQEGAAIAMAALDILIERGSFVLVTTHHGVLKNYGYTNESCVNASVEFNPETLKPTYRLIMGIPGESHALEIARRSGLPEEAIARAKQYINTEQADISALIKGLNQKHKEADDLIQQCKTREEAAAKKEEKILKREQNIKQREHDLKISENKKELSFLKESRKRLENLVRELKEGEVTREKTLGVKNFISSLTSSIENHTAILEAEEKNLEKFKAKQNAKTEFPAQNNRQSEQEFHAAQFEPGAEVLAGTSRNRGTILKQDKPGSWLVQFGNIKMSVKERDLTPVQKTQAGQKPLVSIDLAEPDMPKDRLPETNIPSNRPVFELRLLGMRVDEALKILERQLDLCTIQNFTEFSIIHGKGTGALQQAVTDYLSHYPGVKEFHFARPEDGGSGKTYVRL